MHMRGTPATMNSLNQYEDIGHEVAAELSAQIGAATRAGIARAAIAIDPGIGFAKVGPQNLALLREPRPAAGVGAAAAGRRVAQGLHRHLVGRTGGGTAPRRFDRGGPCSR